MGDEKTTERTQRETETTERETAPAQPQGDDKQASSPSDENDDDA